MSDKAGFLILANLVKYSIGFVLPMVLVRMLSQTDYGTYQQLNLVSTTAVGILTLGVPTSVYYFYHQVGEPRRATLIVQTSLLVTFGGLLAGGLVYFFAPQISAQLGNPSMTRVLAVSALALPFTIASEHAMAFVISQDRFQAAVVFETLETVLRLVLVLVPLQLGYGLIGVIVSLVGFSLARCLSRNWYLLATSHVNYSNWSQSTFVREQLNYSIPVALVSVTALIGGTFNKGIVAASFSPAQYAIYAVGSFPIPLATIFQASVADVLRASLPPLVRDGNLTEVVRLVREATRKLCVIVLPSFVFLFGFAQQLITLLFTKQYAESVEIFRILILTVPLDMLILSAIPQVFGKTRVNFYVNILTMVVLVVLSYFMLKMFGFYGAAIASVTARYLGSAVFLYVTIRLTRSSLLRIVAWGNLLRTIGASIVAFLVARTIISITASNLINVILAGFVYSGSFCAVATLMGVLTKEDRSLIKRWVRKFVPAFSA